MFAGTALTVCAVAVLVAARWSGRHATAAAAKVIASTAFLWTAYAAGALMAGAYGNWIFAGLSLGWFGDVFLLARDSKPLFLAGLVSFLLGHIAYIVALMIYGGSAPIAGAGLALLFVVGVGFFRWLGPSVRGSMRWAVMAYIAVISVMLALGLSTFGREAARWLVPGSLLFYLSDIGVALDRFRPLRVPAYVWSLPIYYGAQLCFAWSVRVAI